MNLFLISIGLLFTGCAVVSPFRIEAVSSPKGTDRLTATADLTDSMRYQVSRQSFEHPVRVDLVHGRKLYLTRITFHADSLYYSCAQRRPTNGQLDELFGRGCYGSKPNASGGALALSNVAAVDYEAEPDAADALLFIVGIPLGFYLFVRALISDSSL